MSRRIVWIVGAFLALMALFFVAVRFTARSEDDPEMQRLAGSLQKELQLAKQEGIPTEFADFYPMPGTDPESGKAKLDAVFPRLGIGARAMLTRPHDTRNLASTFNTERDGIDRLMIVADAKYFGGPITGHAPNTASVGVTGGDGQNLAIAFGHLGLYRLQRGFPDEAIQYFEAGAKISAALFADDLLTPYWNAWLAREHINELMLKAAYGFSSDTAFIDRLKQIHVSTFPERPIENYLAGVFVELFYSWAREFEQKVAAQKLGDTAPIDGVEVALAKSPRFVDANRAVALRTLREITSALRSEQDRYKAAKAADRVLDSTRAQSSPFYIATKHILDGMHLFEAAGVYAFLRDAQTLALEMAKAMHRAGKAPDDLSAFGDLARDRSTGRPFVYSKHADGFFLGMSDVNRGAFSTGGDPYRFSYDGRFNGEWGLMYLRVSVDKDAVMN